LMARGIEFGACTLNRVSAAELIRVMDIEIADF